jgi:hypothetical protein
MQRVGVEGTWTSFKKNIYNSPPPLPIWIIELGVRDSNQFLFFPVFKATKELERRI